MVLLTVWRIFRQQSQLLLLTIFVLFPSMNLFAAHTTGASVLDIPVSARIIGMGQTQTATAQSVDALSSNVAGINRLANANSTATSELGFSHQDHFSESSIDYLGLTMPSISGARAFSWGFNITRLGYADQERRSANGDITGTVSSNDTVLGLAVARNLGGLNVGTQVKLVRLDLDGKVAQSYALDFGMLSRTAVRGLSLGLSVRNVGPQMKFINDGFSLPLSVSVGSAYQVLHPLTLALDVTSRPYDHQISFAIGTELMAMQSLSLRTGYLAKLANAIQNNQQSESDRGNNIAGISGFNMGLGLRLGQFNLDYAMSPFGELGTTQILSLSTAFGAGSNSGAIPKQPRSLETTPTAAPATAAPATAVPTNNESSGVLDIPIENNSVWDKLK
jgi:hypothetical protein